MKESRNRNNNTKKIEYILYERCKFCKKVVDDKEKVVRNFWEIRRQLFQAIFAPQYHNDICDPNFCPPNIYDKSTLVFNTTQIYL